MTDEVTNIPSNDADRKKIKDAISEMSGALQFIEDKREFIKDVCADLEGKYGIPKKLSKKLATVLHKNNYIDVNQDSEEFSTAFELLFGIEDDSDED